MDFILIKQPAGLGDIFFLQKAIKTLAANKEQKVIWPLNSNFMYLTDYIQHDNILFVDKEQDFPFKQIYETRDEPSISSKDNDRVLFIPFINAEFCIGVRGMSNMQAKYPLVNMTSDDWQSYFTFKRNPEREKQMRDKYGIKEGEKFIFVNDLFASPPEMLRRNIDIKTDKKIIYNDGSPCHVFDFCWLFENAAEIHTIESAFCYIVEVLNTKAKLFMYSRMVNGRHQHKNFDYCQHVYKKDWEKIQ